MAKIRLWMHRLVGLHICSYATKSGCLAKSMRYDYRIQKTKTEESVYSICLQSLNKFYYLEYTNTVKPVLSSHSKIYKTKVLMEIVA